MKRYYKLFIISVLYFFLITVFAQENTILYILHTNDTHSQIDPFDSDSMKNVGGYARRNIYIQECRKSGIPVLLLDAGDFSQGSPYFNEFKGYVEIDLMNRMGYDVATLGNHEFDNGVKALGERLLTAKFQVVCANYEFSDPNIKKIVKPYVILKKGGKKIGIFGLTTDLKDLVLNEQGAVYKDPLPIAQELTNYLKKKKHCDLVICLSHLGYFNEFSENGASDSLLAKQVDGIDFIIGGHTHQLFSQPIKINSTWIFQCGYGGESIGKIRVFSTRSPAL
jgi:5'-nucleotidase